MPRATSANPTDSHARPAAPRAAGRARRPRPPRPASPSSRPSGLGGAAPRSPLPARSGFTLIELIAVMVVVAILAATAIPSLSAIGRQKTAGAALRMVRDLSYTRERAMATGTNTWFVVAPATESYSVLQENPASPGRAGATTITDPSTSQPLLVRLGINEAAGVEISTAVFGTGTEVGFDRLGRPLITSGALLTTAGTVTLTGNHQVTLQPRTGRTAYVPGP